ncbi:MAG: threonine synthase, partial [Flavobacteriales bacterium]|nr:threonine synthase [Flavobacteriales bacterium]
MRFYSTKDRQNVVDLREAVLRSLPHDRGLYMPVSIPELAPDFWKSTPGKSLQDIALELASPYLEEDFSSSEIGAIIEQAVNFTAPVVEIEPGIHSLELWHGPSLAFKDFGARFMAAVMSRLVKDESRRLTILVATSGDTGGAVAAGFLGVENVEVIILYPSGKVSPLQEKQLTTLGQNIQAVEVEGTFDDCQALVKRAFLDSELNEKYMLSSANSINIARLIPQSFYYAGSYAQLDAPDDLVFCVPSGNFGNLTAGLIAHRMGLPVQKFIAATNVND